MLNVEWISYLREEVWVKWKEKIYVYSIMTDGYSWSYVYSNSPIALSEIRNARNYNMKPMSWCFPKQKLMSHQLFKPMDLVERRKSVKMPWRCRFQVKQKMVKQ